MKETIVRLLISLVVLYLIVAYLAWDFEWYLLLGGFNVADRLLIGIFIFLSFVFVYYTTSLID